MKYYLGARATHNAYFNPLGDKKKGYFLETFYELRGTKEKRMDELLENSYGVIIDSGAFTFMRSKPDITEQEMDAYFNDYCSFIRRYKDNDKIEGFFELDIDKILGVEKAMKYLSILTKITDKIIPVWHNTRSIDFYYEMCKKYKKVAITQAILSDVSFDQINLFVNTAHQFGAKIHLLGFARLNELKTLNLAEGDSFDAVSYVLTGAFGKIKLYNFDEKEQFEFDFSKIDGFNSTNLGIVNTYYHLQLQKQLLEENEK